MNKNLDQPTDLAPTKQLAFRLLREHIKPYWRRIATAVLFMAFAAMATASLAKLMEPILDDVFVSKDLYRLKVVAGVVLFVFVVKGVSIYVQAVLMDFVGQRIVADIQKRLFKHLLSADLGFFHHTSTGQLISHFNHDIYKMRQTVSNVLTGLGKDSFTLIALIGVMFYQDWVLACIAFFAFPLGFWPIIKLGKRMRKVSFSTQNEVGAMTTLLTQVFQSIRHVKAYIREQYELERMGQYIEAVFRLSHKTERVRSISKPMMETFGGIAIVAVISYGGYQVIMGGKTPGGFFSFITAFLMAYEPLKKLANLNMNLQEGLAAAQRVFKYIDQEPKIKSLKKAKSHAVKKGHIVLKDVTFRYDDSLILDKISLEAKPGKTIALVGASGAGKSTILNLLPRFYDIESGAITIDGIALKDFTLSSLRANMALVSQEISLFDDTIRANIMYGNHDASEEQMIDAAKAAAAYDFIQAQPHGFDTVIGENGASLSGGQRQRLSIARAMIKNAPILLLDEATSALDTESERQVQQALDTLMQDKTTIVIAHRLSTITHADTIYVIEQGHVIESGSHSELLKKEGAYYRLHHLQHKKTS